MWPETSTQFDEPRLGRINGEDPMRSKQGTAAKAQTRFRSLIPIRFWRCMRGAAWLQASPVIVRQSRRPGKNETNLRLFCLRPLRRDCKIQCRAQAFSIRSGEVFIFVERSDAAVRHQRNVDLPQPPQTFQPARANLGRAARSPFRNRHSVVPPLPSAILSSNWFTVRADIRLQPCSFKAYLKLSYQAPH